MTKLLLIVGTALVTSVAWVAITATTGFGARTNFQTYPIDVNDIAAFPLINMNCVQLRSGGGYVVDCTRPSTATAKFVTFTGSKINVWKPAGSCCKALLFSATRNP